MSAPDDGFALLGRLREGDALAQAEFCRCFEPYIRRELRVRLKMDARLCRVLDSVDVCQEVLNSFLMRTSAGEYDLDEVPQLLALIKRMLKNKLSKRRRWFYAERRSLQRQDVLAKENWSAISGDDPSVSRVLANQEMLEEILQHLDEEERQVAQARAEGESWHQIGKRLGASPDALRMKLGRALGKILSASIFLHK